MGEIRYLLKYSKTTAIKTISQFNQVSSPKRCLMETINTGSIKYLLSIQQIATPPIRFVPI